MKVFSRIRSFIRDQGGFNLAELAVATALTVVLGGVTVLISTQVTDVTTSINNRSAVQVTSRDLLNQTLRNMRNARPPGDCKNPVTATTNDACYELGESDDVPAVFYATQDKVCFFSYVTAATSASSAVTPPQKTCLGKATVPDGTKMTKLVLEVWEPEVGAHYVNAWHEANTVSGYAPGHAQSGCSPCTPSSTTELGLVPTADPIFTYYDRYAASIATPVTAVDCDASIYLRDTDDDGKADLCLVNEISRIDVNLTFQSEEFRSEKDQDFFASVSLRGVRYAADQQWGGGLG